MEEHLRPESSEQIQVRRKRMKRNKSRIAELKRRFIGICEESASGQLRDEQSNRKRVQHIHIQYDRLGFIPLNAENSTHTLFYCFTTSRLISIPKKFFLTFCVQWI